MSHLIAGVRTRLLRLPMLGALRWGSASELRELEHVLVEVRTAGEVDALSEAPVRPTIYGETVASICEVAERVIGPRLVGLSLSDPAALSAAVDSLPFNHAARGAIDTALRLAAATVAGSTLSSAIGATRGDTEVSFILGLGSLQSTLDEAQRVVGAGVRVLKVKLSGDEKRDDSLLAALAHAFAGGGVVLYADANESLAPERTEERLARLASLGVAWVEEPLPVRMLRRRAELRRNSPLPIIADDSCFSPQELERELDFDSFDILNVKPARTGVSKSLAMMELAAEAGKGVMVGSQAASGLGTVHAAALALRPEVTFPCELTFPLKLERDSLMRPLRYLGGRLTSAEIDAARPAPVLYHVPDASTGGVRMTAESRRTPDE